jgi:hypothetical protein
MVMTLQPLLIKSKSVAFSMNWSISIVSSVGWWQITPRTYERFLLMIVLLLHARIGTYGRYLATMRDMMPESEYTMIRSI